MPNRILYDGIRQSESVNALTDNEFRTYILLLTVCDDFGRYHGDARLVVSACYPFGDVTRLRVEKDLQSMFAKGVIALYAVDGKRYIEVMKWRQRTRAQESKFPPLSANDGQVPVKRPSHAHVFGDGDGDGDVDSHAPPNGAQQSVPPVIEIPLRKKDGNHPITTEQIAEWSEDFPAADVMAELRKLRAWSNANPSKKKTAAGINKCIVSWLSRVQDKGGNGTGAFPAKQKQGWIP